MGGEGEGVGGEGEGVGGEGEGRSGRGGEGVGGEGEGRRGRGGEGGALLVSAETASHVSVQFLEFKDLPEEHPLYQPEYDFIIERFTQLALPRNSSEQ